MRVSLRSCTARHNSTSLVWGLALEVLLILSLILDNYVPVRAISLLFDIQMLLMSLCALAQDVTPYPSCFILLMLETDAIMYDLKPISPGANELGLSNTLKILVISLNGDEVGDPRATVLKQGSVLEELRRESADAKERHTSHKLVEMVAVFSKNCKDRREVQEESGGKTKANHR